MNRHINGITVTDYVSTYTPPEKTPIIFAKPVVIKELDKVFIEQDGKEITLKEWIRQVVDMRGEE